MRQDLVNQFDFQKERVFAHVDDCNLKFIDTHTLKRFLKKCGVIADKKIIICIIRRFDLDCDSRLSKEEFLDGIQPLERFTRQTL